MSRSVPLRLGSLVTQPLRSLIANSRVFPTPLSASTRPMNASQRAFATEAAQGSRGQTISEAIGADHKKFNEYRDNIKNSNDDAAKVRWRNQLTWTVARHAISEELTLYPAMTKHLGEEGVMLAKTDKEQHQGVKNYLYQLQDMTPADPKFEPTLKTPMDLLHHHVEHEANEDMPRLEGLLSRHESEAIARSFERTKGIVPNRSHPAAPTEYYLENLAGLLATPIDRYRAWLSDFPTEQDKQAARS